MNNTARNTADWGNGWTIASNGTGGDSSISNNHSFSTTTSHTIHSTGISSNSGPGSGSGGCNESKAHNNEEKALFHGLKSAYRMSREFDGEYGTDDPPYETAARIAAEVAIAFLQTTDQAYTREESFEYIEENFARSPGVVESYLSDPPLDARVGESEFKAAIGRAWEQIDSKWNHYDSARTALAAADLFLGGEIEGHVQEIA